MSEVGSVQMSAGKAGTADSLRSAEEALERAFKLLEQQPQAALEEASRTLSLVPGHPVARLVIAIAQRLLNDTSAALSTLAALAAEQPNAAAVRYEYGRTLAAVGRGEDAVRELRRAVELQPSLPGAWRALGDHLMAMGDTAGADAAYAQHIRAAIRDPRLMRAAAALCGNDIPVAESLLREHLRAHPTDVAAIRMLAEVAARIGRFPEAENLLMRCLELAPSFVEARAHYATVLSRVNRPLDALAELEKLLARDPRNPNHRNLKATVLVSIGEYERAIALYAGLVAEYPAQSKVWMSYGHVLKTAGRREDCIQAYRRCIALTPELGEAWFTLANLKTFRFSADDASAMEKALSHESASVEDKFHLHFALGKHYEDAAQYEKSFHHYSEGNRLRRTQIHYRPEDTTRLVERTKTLFTREFLAERAGAGCPAKDPIFVVGLPRAGSTLVDQILSSHSQVEGTSELYELIDLARSLGAAQSSERYLETLANLEPAALRSIGEQYLERTRIHRKTSAPFFVDKMPNNFLHTGLIALALPEAKIIDVRRYSLSCCFSVFKQHFARGQHFSYDLTDVGYYYRDYLELMEHFANVLPGKVHRVDYESLVENTEHEVRSLLAYCGLPFEEKCLRFYENERAVRTASSEQVRQPIFRDGLEQWRHYESWLGPLKAALGSIID